MRGSWGDVFTRCCRYSCGTLRCNRHEWRICYLAMLRVKWKGFYCLLSLTILLGVLVPTLQQRRVVLRPPLAPDSVGYVLPSSNVEITNVFIPTSLADKLRSGAKGVTICHWADFHAHVESSPDADPVPVCSDSEFNVSRASLIYQALEKYCPMRDTEYSLRLFTGDLMAGSEYDSISPREGLPPVAAELMKLWMPSAWIAGNHDFNEGHTLLANISKFARVPLIASNLKLAPKVPQLDPIRAHWRRAQIIHVHDSASQSAIKPLLTVCLYGILIASLTEHGQAASPFFEIEKAYDESLETTLNETTRHCSESGSSELPPLRILMTHIGFDSDKALIKKLNLSASARDKPIVHFVAGAHSHTLINPEDYPLLADPNMSETSPVLSHTAAFGDVVSVTGFVTSTNISTWRIDHTRSEMVVVTNMSKDAATLDIACTIDKDLLTPARNIILSRVQSQVQQAVATMPPTFFSNSYTCRGCPCGMGVLVAHSMWLAVHAYFATPSSAHKLVDIPQVEECPAGEVAGALYLEQQLLALRRFIEDSSRPTLFVALEAAGNLRGIWPPLCSSPFQKVAGGCDMQQTLTAYDIDISLPFRSPLIVARLKSAARLCQLLDRSFSAAWQAGVRRTDGLKRTPAYIHVGGAKVYVNSLKYDQRFPKPENKTVSSGFLLDIDNKIASPEVPSFLQESDWTGARAENMIEIVFRSTSGKTALESRCVLDPATDQFRLLHKERNAGIEAEIVIATSDWVLNGGDGIINPAEDLYFNPCMITVQSDCEIPNFPCTLNNAVLRHLNSSFEALKIL
eukprot:Gregarina_sp_Poly_1__2455@NODE_1663_length_3587_cov_168_519602_g1091_i0_p1_GENE_NODE_1663_length_3587_cov_168_519602_g1091_i0NODE_1663_length_3587_cov_168_519602_g1091_i0_p1_ORF_typecomplete_len799_score100_70Metallophos/PF00149_28/0_0011Metallophos_2/PF12850_7/0_057_NODE_1663_length_3587_cov_168_519602_g1091_i01832579